MDVINECRLYFDIMLPSELFVGQEKEQLLAEV